MIDCTVLAGGDWVLRYRCDREARHGDGVPETYLLVRRNGHAQPAPEGWEWLVIGDGPGGDVLCPECVQERLKNLFEYSETEAQKETTE